MTIHLATGLNLPLDAATQTFLVVGKRGSGKSSTATRLAEQFIAAKVQVAVLDPVDVWWGLKAGGDGGRDGGLEVYVFGGAHHDLPIEPTAGVLMADTLVDHRINAVFMLREFSNREKARFVSDFAEQLFKRNREVLHLFCEEAHEVMPQNPYKGEEEMLGRMLRLEKLGRTSGIGMSAITQRPASLNKNATTQAEVLVAHRIIGPQDRSAIEEWIKYHHVAEQKSEVLASLAELKTGEAWIWAPDFPEDKPIGLRRVHVLLPETFDSRKTPKPGERRVEPSALAAVDLEKLGAKMAATRERAKASDPDELRRTIATLRRENAGLQKATAPTKLEIKEIERSVLKEGQLNRAHELEHALDSALNRIDDVLPKLREAVEPIASALRAVAASTTAPTAVRAAAPGASLHRPSGREAEQGTSGVPPRRTPAPRSGEPRVTEGAPKRYLQKILDALASLEAIGYARATNLQVATWAKMSVRGGAYGGYVRELIAAGMIERSGTQKESQLWLVPSGRRAAQAHDLATSDLHAMAHAVAKPYLHKVLDPLLSAYPSDLDLSDLALRADMSIDGGAFGGYVRELRALGFVTSTKQFARASDALFLEASRT